jgi:hypothetical protein
VSMDFISALRRARFMYYVLPVTIEQVKQKMAFVHEKSTMYCKSTS